MESNVYPIQHFEMMRELATRVKAFPILILSHAYHYEAFGSWWFQFKRSGQRYRIVFDGKDQKIRLETNIGDELKAEWGEIRIVDVLERDAESTILLVCTLLETI